jgi:hypothetical protein
MTDLPSKIDRAAIERIIQRAAELQTGERDIADGLTADEVVTLGKEVGIPERYLKQALLEESGRSDLPEERGALDRTFGPGIVSTARVVRGDPDDLTARLLGWMEDEELLTVQRSQPGRITWEPVRGMAVAIRRSTAAIAGNKSFMLSRAQVVRASITGLEPGFTHIGLSADLRQARGAIIGGVGALAGVGTAGVAVLALMSPFWWVALAPIPIIAPIAWGVSRQFRPQAERALLGLERALDFLEHGELKPAPALPPRAAGLLGAVLDEVRKAMK